MYSTRGDTEVLILFYRDGVLTSQVRYSVTPDFLPPIGWYKNSYHYQYSRRDDSEYILQLRHYTKNSPQEQNMAICSQYGTESFYTNIGFIES